MNPRVSTVASSFAICIFLASGTAFAQEAPAGAPAVNEEGVDEIVVTAQRRAERLQEVPLSVTALSSEDLDRAGINDVSRLEQVTPGFTFGRSGSDARPSIRGVRTETVNATNDPSIGFYLDGVYQSRAQQALIPLVDVSRVEVLRGPQGTLYGRNTFGGNVSVITNAPTDLFEGGGSLRFSNFDTQQYEAYLNVPVSANAGFRFAGVRNRSDGYVKSDVNPEVSLFDRDEWLGRGSFRWAPSDALEVILRAGYWENSGQGGGAYGYRVAGTLVNAAGVRSINGSPVPFNPTVRDGIADINGVDIGVPVTGDEYTNSWDYVPFERTHEVLASAQVNYTFGEVVLRSITGWQKFRTDRTADLDQTGVVFPAPGVVAGFPGSGYQRNDTNARTFSQEFQLASVASKPLQWIVGLYGLRDDLDERYSQVYTAASATAADTRAVTKLKVTSYAAYAQASYYLLPDTLRLTGGVRYTYEKKEFGIVNYSYPQSGTGEVRGTSSEGDPTYKKTIWKAGADYFVTPDNMLYVNVSTGFRSGGVNNNTANSAIPYSFGPENVTAWEIGSKNRFANGKVQLNLSAFDYRFRDLQITILNQATNLSYIQNAGKAHSRGFDATLDLVPARGLHLNGSATYLEAKFDDYTRPNDFYTATNGDPRLLSFAGNQIPMSPEWKFTGNVYYDAEIAGLGTVTPYFSWLHSSSYQTLDYNTVLDRQPPYDKIDLRLAWRSEDGRLGLEGFVENLTDVAVLNRSVLGSNQRIQQSFQPPRTYGVKLSFDF